MNEQAWRIRRRLRGIGPAVSIKWLADDLAIPQPSIRRSLTELSLEGFYIVHRNHVLTVKQDNCL